MAVVQSMLAAGIVAIAAGQVCPSTPSPRETIEAACTASAPLRQPFAGEVLQVLDGHTICVAQGPTPSAWVRVTVADASVETERSALMVTVFGRRVVCVAEQSHAQGVTGHCALDGVSLGRLVAEPAVRVQAAFWR